MSSKIPEDKLTLAGWLLQRENNSKSADFRSPPTYKEFDIPRLILKKELSNIMFGCGDSVQQDEESLRLVSDIVTQFMAATIHLTLDDCARNSDKTGSTLSVNNVLSALEMTNPDIVDHTKSVLSKRKQLDKFLLIDTATDAESKDAYSSVFDTTAEMERHMMELSRLADFETRVSNDSFIVMSREEIMTKPVVSHIAPKALMTPQINRPQIHVVPARRPPLVSTKKQVSSFPNVIREMDLLGSTLSKDMTIEFRTKIEEKARIWITTFEENNTPENIAAFRRVLEPYRSHGFSFPDRFHH